MRISRKKFLRLRAESIAWRNYAAIRYEQTNRLLSLELAAYTYTECLIAAATCPALLREYVGYAAEILYARTGRGSLTLDAAIKKIGEK